MSCNARLFAAVKLVSFLLHRSSRFVIVLCCVVRRRNRADNELWFIGLINENDGWQSKWSNKDLHKPHCKPIDWIAQHEVDIRSAWDVNERQKQSEKLIKTTIIDQVSATSCAKSSNYANATSAAACLRSSWKFDKREVIRSNSCHPPMQVTLSIMRTKLYDIESA